MSTKKTAIRGQVAVSRDVYWEGPRRRTSAPQQQQAAQPAPGGVSTDGSPVED